MSKDPTSKQAGDGQDDASAHPATPTALGQQVANLDLSKELYERSGWVDTQNYWKSLINHAVTEWKPFKVVDFNAAKIPEDFGERTYPAYDAGYLLRKLPKRIGRYSLAMWTYPDGDGYAYGYHDVLADRWAEKPGQRGAAQPENALCKLAIELFKQGVIK